MRWPAPPGIGAAIAETLGRLGADLTLIGRNQEGLDERADKIASASAVKVHVETADVWIEVSVRLSRTLPP